MARQRTPLLADTEAKLAPLRRTFQEVLARTFVELYIREGEDA
jgi:hypothetical protein